MITKPVKYTAEFVLKELNSMLDRLTKDKKGEKIYFIGELFYHKPYVRQNFSEWANKFNDNNPEISDTIKKIENLLETNLVREGLKKKIDKTCMIFVLKNRYGWKDVQETTHTVKFDEKASETAKKMAAEALGKV